jgi:YggT family protein
LPSCCPLALLGAAQVFTTGMVNFLNLYNSALIVRLVLTWFPNPPEVIVGPLS